MRIKKLYYFFFISVQLGLVSCGPKDDNQVEYNRLEMLHNLSNSVIEPQLNTFSTQLDGLNAAKNTFVATPNSLNLSALQDAYKNAYLAWEAIEVYEFGPSADYILRASLNSFPTDTLKIKSNISAGTYDLDLSTNIMAKGFPALDYLLFGIGSTNAAIVAMYTIDGEASKRITYLNDVLANMTSRFNAVKNAWVNYEGTFISNTSLDVGSSVGLLVNSMSMSLESVRRERIGTPLGYVGLIQSGTVFPALQEGYYANFSRELAGENIIRSKELFNGGTGSGLDDYLNAINAQYETGTPLAEEINAQYDRTIAALQALTPDYTTVLNSDKPKAEAAFLEVKKLVILIKLDMASQLGVVINYTDNDGD